MDLETPQFPSGIVSETDGLQQIDVGRGETITSRVHFILTVQRGAIRVFA
jgi:hypothetical protein